MPFARTPNPRWLGSIRDLQRVPFWLDRPGPDPAPPLTGPARADLVIVGAGFTGLWAALLARQRDPSCDVVILEADRTAGEASGRNGGFVAASITHGLANGLARWPDEFDVLHRLGMENLDAIGTAVADHAIDCDWLRTGELTVAVEHHQAEALRELASVAAARGIPVEWLEADDVRRIVDSPSYLGALRDASGVAMADPARLAWGLRRAAIDAGVRIHEGSPVRRLRRDGRHLAVTTEAGSVRAQRVLLATGAQRSLLRRVRPYLAPVYDYVLVSEPLSAEQRRSVGWDPRVGVGDGGNLFHYYRMTRDSRILWGGYDAVYHWRGRVSPAYDADEECFGRLADHFFATFPQLEGLRFTHGWGGAIDTCSRFSAFWGRAHGGRVAYVGGYTGLGVGASRFGAATALDLLDGLRTERTSLEMVRSRPLPFPPEPLKSVGVALMRRSLESADRNSGRRNLLLRVTDALGMGFDS